MDLDEIEKILELMREHELAEFELESESTKLRLRKHGPAHWTATPPVAPRSVHAPARCRRRVRPRPCRRPTC